jgi:Signal transduction histidine kinase
VVALEFARALLDTDPAAARRELEDLTAQVEEALERVRALARTVYPSILPARGLTDALRSLDVETADLERYPLEIEEAIYFSCDALRNRASQGRVWSDGERFASSSSASPLSRTTNFRTPASESRRRAVELDLSEGRVSASVPLR